MCEVHATRCQLGFNFPDPSLEVLHLGGVVHSFAAHASGFVFSVD